MRRPLGARDATVAAARAVGRRHAEAAGRAAVPIAQREDRHPTVRERHDGSVVCPALHMGHAPQQAQQGQPASCSARCSDRIRRNTLKRHVVKAVCWVLHDLPTPARVRVPTMVRAGRPAGVVLAWAWRSRGWSTSHPSSQGHTCTCRYCPQHGARGLCCQCCMCGLRYLRGRVLLLERCIGGKSRRWQHQHTTDCRQDS